MNRLFKCQQQSDLWNAARRGRITGSGVMAMIAPPITRASTRGPAGTEAAAKASYRKQLIVERVYKREVNHYVSRAMEEGLEREPYARMLYEAEVLQDTVTQVGFALHPEWDFFGCSPDSVCWAKKGGQEFKCPTDQTHDSYCQDLQSFIDEYKGQSLAGLICFPDFEWWDQYSFSPYAPDSIKLVGYRFHRSDWAETIQEIQDAALEFNSEVEAIIAARGLPPTVWDVMPDGKLPEPEETGRLEGEDYINSLADVVGDETMP